MRKVQWRVSGIAKRTTSIIHIYIYKDVRHIHHGRHPYDIHPSLQNHGQEWGAKEESMKRNPQKDQTKSAVLRPMEKSWTTIFWSWEVLSPVRIIEHNPREKIKMVTRIHTSRFETHQIWRQRCGSYGHRCPWTPESTSRSPNPTPWSIGRS